MLLLEILKVARTSIESFRMCVFISYLKNTFFMTEFLESKRGSF